MAEMYYLTEGRVRVFPKNADGEYFGFRAGDVAMFLKALLMISDRKAAGEKSRLRSMYEEQVHKGMGEEGISELMHRLLTNDYHQNGQYLEGRADVKPSAVQLVTALGTQKKCKIIRNVNWIKRRWEKHWRRRGQTKANSKTIEGELLKEDINHCEHYSNLKTEQNHVDLPLSYGFISLKSDLAALSSQKRCNAEDCISRQQDAESFEEIQLEHKKKIPSTIGSLVSACNLLNLASDSSITGSQSDQEQAADPLLFNELLQEIYNAQSNANLNSQDTKDGSHLPSPYRILFHEGNETLLHEVVSSLAEEKWLIQQAWAYYIKHSQSVNIVSVEPEVHLKNESECAGSSAAKNKDLHLVINLKSGEVKMKQERFAHGNNLPSLPSEANNMRKNKGVFSKSNNIHKVPYSANKRPSFKKSRTSKKKKVTSSKSEEAASGIIQMLRNKNLNSAGDTSN